MTDELKITELKILLGFQCFWKMVIIFDNTSTITYLVKILGQNTYFSNFLANEYKLKCLVKILGKNAWKKILGLIFGKILGQMLGLLLDNAWFIAW